jgi:hypothetical protein
MGSFVVETFVPQDDPDRFVVDVRSLRVAVRAAPRAPGGPRYLRSYLVPDDAMGFHVIEAETADEVARLARLANVEVERIVSAVSVATIQAERLAADVDA